MYTLPKEMINAFTSQRQEKIYGAVLSRLRGVGYSGELLQEGYHFNDWFVSDCPQRTINAAAFARVPLSYDTACFGVFLAGNNTLPERIAEFRALGAPVALEVRDDGVVPWRVGRDIAATTAHPRIPPELLDKLFRDRESDWLPTNMLRMKNIAAELGPQQLDFIDLGLIPALEHQISSKLHRLLHEVLQVAQRTYRQSTGEQPDDRRLFRLVFRFLAAKVLHDRNIEGFRSLADSSGAKLVLERVSRYYHEKLPVLEHAATQQAVMQSLWQQVSFQNLSVEVLAYIYENTLVDPNVRKELGIHSTPSSIARYVVNRLPLDDIPDDERVIVEPCSGHGIFMVAALKRLRDLLSKPLAPQARHRYFVRMLHGFERDPFAIEVSKLCLLLADFPNPNGWRIQPGDVFSSSKLVKALHKARIILCNPPYEDFEPAERRKYRSLHSVQKPVELLHRVLNHASENALLGFVLPRQFISGKGYGEIRQVLAKRYRDLEIVALPDRVFRHSQLETSLLISRAVGTAPSTTVSFVEVKDRDRQRFLDEHRPSRHDLGHKSADEAAHSLLIPPLNEVWERLSQHPRLGEAVDIHRGVEWQQPFDARRYLSPMEKPGFVPGLHSAAGELVSYQVPKSTFLSIKKEHQRGNAFALAWEKPKVVMNAVRISRWPWCIAAFPEASGLVCTQNFHCLWPKPGWNVNTICAVLNSPVVNAFVASHAGKLHIQKRILASAPLPLFAPPQLSELDALVAQYLAAMSGNPHQALDLWQKRDDKNHTRHVLLEIDALILRGYNLPPRMERQLLDFFRGQRRPVPFEFGDYFPPDFTPTIPLGMYISADFQKCTAERLLKTIPKITDPTLLAVLKEVE